MDSDLCGVQSGGLRQFPAGIPHCGTQGRNAPCDDLPGRVYHKPRSGEYIAGRRRKSTRVRGREGAEAFSPESAGNFGGRPLCGIQLLYGDKKRTAPGHDQCPQSYPGGGGALPGDDRTGIRLFRGLPDGGCGICGGAHRFRGGDLQGGC